MDKEFQHKPFILSREVLKNTWGWFEHSQEFSSVYFYYDDKTEMIEQKHNGIKVILVGYILDISDGKKSTEDILEELCGLYNRETTTSFHEKLDFLNGRYILLIDDGEDTKLYTDATCMRPVYYWNREIFGSHEALVREVVNAEKDVGLVKRDYRMNGFLDFTSTEDVFKMNPNLYYSASDAAFTRHYPREKNMRLDTEEVVANTIDYFKPQVEWLASNYGKIYQSLTGGYDSKVSLALTKPIMDKIEYFTYMIDLENTPDSDYSRIYRRDKDLVDRLVYNLNLNHKYYFFNEYSVPKDYESKIRSNVSSSHSYMLSYLTYKEFERNQIHVKSTIYEIAKLPYSKKYDYAHTKEALLKVVGRWAPEKLKSEDGLIEEMYEEFIKRTSFEAVKNTGYNLPMMLYWETRMANWHSNITQETDNVVETFVFVNNRHMLNQFLYLDTDSKKNRQYFDMIISEFWPILNYFIPNSYETLEDKVKKNQAAAITEEKQKSQINHRGLKVTGLNNLELTSNTDELEIKPLESTKLKDETIAISMKNQGEVDIKIAIIGHYKHSEKNIFIRMNEERYSINDFIDGKIVNVPAGEKLTVSYEYTKNFDRISWYKAGKLTIRQRV